EVRTSFLAQEKMDKIVSWKKESPPLLSLGFSISGQNENHHKWETFKMAANLPRIGHPSKFTPRSDCAMLRESEENSRAVRRKLLVLKQTNLTAQLKFAKLHMNDFKLQMLTHNAQQHVWRKRYSTSTQTPHINWGDKQGLMPQDLGTMRSLSRACTPVLGPNWVMMMQHNNDARCSSKSTERPDLDPIEMLWCDLKRAVQKQMPSNLNKLKQRCKESFHAAICGKNFLFKHTKLICSSS
uniref:Tc1-like transposase DDE domain-containing protein n=1 Tax=Kryptolebias marmoratus TaxID=37003 RepID=A0A3Q2ZGL4_KRYMA